MWCPSFGGKGIGIGKSVFFDQSGGSGEVSDPRISTFDPVCTSPSGDLAPRWSSFVLWPSSKNQQQRCSYGRDRLAIAGTPLTQEDKAALRKEILDYEGNWRFHQKIQEVQGLRAPDPRQPAILAFFKEKNLLKKGMSVLDLGSAAGSMLKLVKHELDGLGGHGILTGVELTPGWVEAGNAALRPDATILEGDATDFTFALPASSYDFVMMNDSMEHIITSRYACLFERLKKYTSPGSLVYMHVPSPETQLDDQHQHARPRRHLSLVDATSVWTDSCRVGSRASPSFQPRKTRARTRAIPAGISKTSSRRTSSSEAWPSTGSSWSTLARTRGRCTASRMREGRTGGRAEIFLRRTPFRPYGISTSRPRRRRDLPPRKAPRRYKYVDVLFFRPSTTDVFATAQHADHASRRASAAPPGPTRLPRR